MHVLQINMFWQQWIRATLLRLENDVVRPMIEETGKEINYLDIQ